MMGRKRRCGEFQRIVVRRLEFSGSVEVYRCSGEGGHCDDRRAPRV